MLTIALGHCGDYNELAELIVLIIDIEDFGLAKSSYNISNHIYKSQKGGAHSYLCMVSILSSSVV